MARYRKIDVRIWGDSRVRALSPMPPCGAGLWFYILTGPHTDIIPGVIVSGPAAMAEALDWPPEAFMEAFRQVLAEGLMEADSKARIMWVPKALWYNWPESPNVIRSWSSAWDEIPECGMKTRIWEAMQEAFKSKSDAYLKAFHEACPEPCLKASAKPCPKTRANQEQEQEQEKEVPPTPLQGGQEPKPRTPKRRTRAQIFQPYPDAVRLVANAALAEWRKADPTDGRLIAKDPAQLCANLDAILRENPEATTEGLIQAFRNYLQRPRTRYRAPQWFFGTGTPDAPAPWVGEFRLVFHQQQRKAEGDAPAEG